MFSLCNLFLRPRLVVAVVVVVVVVVVETYNQENKLLWAMQVFWGPWRLANGEWRMANGEWRLMLLLIACKR